MLAKHITKKEMGDEVGKVARLVALAPLPCKGKRCCIIQQSL